MRTLFAIIAFLCLIPVSGQDQLEYQQPPEEILELATAPLAPYVWMTDNGQYMLMLYRSAYKSIGELSQPEMRLAGLRINPKTNTGSRTTFYNNLEIQIPGEAGTRAVTGLPEEPRLADFSLSPDEEKLALTHTTANGVELWVVELASATARRLTGPELNANLRDVINWFGDSRALLVKTLPADREPLIDRSEVVPSGPTIATNDGKKAQNRTYQDLIKNPDDAFNFEQLARSELTRVSLEGTAAQWMGPGMYRNISFSPDGNYVMVTTVEKPFSYLVPYYRFPSRTAVYSKDGALVQTVLEVPLIEDLPKGFMAERTGMRDLSWRNDRPATLVYVEALDGGDPAVEVPYRDQVFTLEAPFEAPGKPLLKTRNRFRGITWGTDQVAIARDYWWNNRNTKTYRFNPSDPEEAPVVLSDRNYQDRYSDPGNFVTRRNEWNREVLAMDRRGRAFLLGDGYSEEGQFPFLDRMDLATAETTRLYESRLEGKMESLIDYKPEKDELLVQIESPSEYPNYYSRSAMRRRAPVQLTHFENPFKSLQEVQKEVITYRRDDGLELSGTLYLPVGYDPDSGEKKPMILWAYPREFKDKNSASQNTRNPNEFTYPYWGSPIYWVARGYVVLDDAAFPIIGEGDAQPNDSFRQQLVANARAAIDAVDERGYIDQSRVAVGGHSYGAFMVANLLSHSDLFAAGIARSGAYNRTLTPFGFQSEERNYWEAPEVYYTMSPFMHADKMKTPLLLIHGEADNNSGTYPMQSERYFNALKGLGATVRLVMLPKESHGYRAKESILHLLWEQDRWLEKYLKPEPGSPAGKN
ncbi:MULTISPECIES: S9 family peptidase [unclassified Robiginitalea]|uniref:S9 family peptidase n=1 Tax=Robiginitalea TaxID=252306 RepID=UPI0023493B60|nr:MULTISPECIES: prolyl oligopeptidase family serine peptidase [unclassified Robiginitalea]MDC6354764.1 prolyl oligopeptidase family serine peptidase [Robiginitalea sp. PM2]MDC6375030.1 prolyl oligopeptidase family serine peptidase [Robiginitalea sp. SP8]